jgi:hypothetical protein
VHEYGTTHPGRSGTIRQQQIGRLRQPFGLTNEDKGPTFGSESALQFDLQTLGALPHLLGMKAAKQAKSEARRARDGYGIQGRGPIMLVGKPPEDVFQRST